MFSILHGAPITLKMLPKIIVVLLASQALLAPGMALSWGNAAHKVVGVLAVERAAPDTLLALENLLGTMEPEYIAGACNWPDVYKFSAGGADNIPLHFVNIEAGAEAYRRSRDCPDRQCLPEAVTHFAGRLGDPQLAGSERQIAFAMLCHLVADLHQPLHVAYADDQGGTLVTVEYQGQEVSLHMYWDVRLLAANSGSWQELAAQLGKPPNPPRPPPWRPADVTDWTNETWTFTKFFAYPTGRRIDGDYEKRSWEVAREQLDSAATRLAAILDAVLSP